MTPAGERFVDLNLPTAAWDIPEGVARRFLGHHHPGDGTVFVYTTAGATVHDGITLRSAKLVQTRSIDGTLPDGLSFGSPLKPAHEQTRIQRLLDAPNAPR